MKQFNQVVKEINKSLNQLLLFENITNATLVFLVFYLVLLLVDFSPFFALIPAALYLVYYSYGAMKTSKALMVEGKYAPLREKLRTAADNLNVDNPVIEELEYEVTAEMKNVGLSMFLNPKTLSYKIFAVMALSFMIIFATTMNLRLLDLAKQKVPEIFDRSGIKGVGNLIATKLNATDEIYGKGDVAKLGDNELDIRIKPVDFRVNVREEGDVDQHAFESVFPQEIIVKETVAYEENIPQEQQELVKNYFKKLAEG